MKVLVVDDSAALRARLALVLRELCGADEVHEAADAESALALARRWIPDVVVLDLHMPGAGGLSIVAELKGISPPATVIVLTNDASDVYRRESLARGADYFFDKSKDVDLLIAVVGERPTPSTDPTRSASRSRRKSRAAWFCSRTRPLASSTAMASAACSKINR